MNLEGKVIWVTGASSGIGKAIVEQLSRIRKTQIIVSSRREPELEDVKSRCEAAGVCESIETLTIDLAETETLFESARQAWNIFGKIDIVIHNAGISQRSLALETDMQVFDQIMRVNYLGTVALTQALLPFMVNNGGGNLIVVSSLVGKFGTPMRSGYAASKHALHGYFDSLRAELHEQGIRVLIACPGFVRTNISINALTADGSTQGTMDRAQKQGMPAHQFARKLLKALVAGREEIAIGGRERFAVYLKRFWPSLFSRLIRTARVT